jgi:putative oxidoreductase
MALLSPATPRQLALGIALVRIITGIIFVAHGYVKFFGMGIPGVTGFFNQIGIPAANIAAPFVAALELAGGIALVLGLFTRLLGFAFAINMLVAIVLVRLKGGFFAPNGAEFEILLGVASVALMIAGAGALSIDEAIAKRRFVTSESYARTL